MSICSADGNEVQCAGPCFIMVMFGSDSIASCGDAGAFEITPPKKLQRSDSVTVCAKEFPTEKLDEILGKVVDEPVSRADSRTEPVTLDFKGTVDELLEHVGLGRGDGNGGGYAA
jgi:hypothetical protein